MLLPFGAVLAVHNMNKQVIRAKAMSGILGMMKEAVESDKAEKATED